jgi:hypothetical protein
MGKLKLATLATMLLAAAGAEAQTRDASSQAGTFTLGAEALYWSFNDSPMPVPLVTNGAVGQSSTETYLGGKGLDTGNDPGLRLSGAYVLSSESGIEANVFHIPSRSTRAGVASSGETGSTNLVIPYVDAATGVESFTEISFAPLYRGEASEKLSNDLLGAEINGTRAMAPLGAWHTDLLGGIRYLRLRETYTLNISSPYIPPFPQDIWNTTEEFDASNHFYGAQAGVRARYEHGAFFANGTAKLALGAMAQSVDISGSLTTNDFNDFGATQTFFGGYFALPSNIGNYSRTRFAAMSELGLNLGYQVTRSLAILVDYNFVHVNNVVRPGNQISRTINPTQSTSYTEDPQAQLDGPAMPAFKYKDSGFRSQGISVGVAIRF